MPRGLWTFNANKKGDIITASTELKTKVGSVFSLFNSDGERYGSARVVEDLSKDPKYTSEKYVDPRRVVPENPLVNMAKNMYKLVVEHDEEG